MVAAVASTAASDESLSSVASAQLEGATGSELVQLSGILSPSCRGTGAPGLGTVVAVRSLRKDPAASNVHRNLVPG